LPLPRQGRRWLPDSRPHKCGLEAGGCRLFPCPRMGRYPDLRRGRACRPSDSLFSRKRNGFRRGHREPTSRLITEIGSSATHTGSNDASLGVRLLSAKSARVIDALDCLPNAFRSQGFSPSQRFIPTRPSRLCFTPLPPLGFWPSEPCSTRPAVSPSGDLLLSCRWTSRAVESPRPRSAPVDSLAFAGHPPDSLHRRARSPQLTGKNPRIIPGATVKTATPRREARPSQGARAG